MNTFIKRSIKIALAIVFIGAAAVPACAQKKGVNKIPKVISQPPHTGLSSVTRLRGPSGSILRPAALTKELSARIERETFQKSREIKLQNDLQNLLKKPELAKEILKHPFAIEEWNSKIDFRNLITPQTPDYLPVFGFSTHLEEDASEQIHQLNKGTDFPSSFLDALEYCTQLDLLFFTEKEGQVFVDVSIIKNFSSYDAALEELKFSHPYSFDIIKEYLHSFAALRTMQIAIALKTFNNLQKPQIDPTTQRTAEEIQSLIENLDPQNPLRQAIEGSLKTAAQDGHITPIK